MVCLDADLQWLAPSAGRAERLTVFNDAAIQLCLTLKCMFGLQPNSELCNSAVLKSFGICRHLHLQRLKAAV